MSTEVRWRRGTTAENDGFTGAEAEITVDTERKELRVHDGSNKGGTRLARTGTDGKEVPTNADLRVDTIEDLLALSTDNARSIYVHGFYEVGDGGGGPIYWDGSRPKSDHNGGTVIDPDHSVTPGESGWWESENDGDGCWVRSLDYVTPQKFGVKEGLSIDSSSVPHNTTGMNAALDECVENGLELFIPGGRWVFDGTLEAGGDIRIRGSGMGSTIVYFTHPEDAGSDDTYTGIRCTEDSVVTDFSIESDKERFDSSNSYGNGYGAGAIVISGVERFYVGRIYVDNWLGTGILTFPKDGGEGTVDTCYGYNLGRPKNSPGIEHGDFFYLDSGGRSKVSVRNCHYVDPRDGGSENDERMTRGGFVCTSADDELQVKDCSSVSAHRAIHFEDAPYMSSVENFYGKDARNGIIYYGAGRGDIEDVSYAFVKNSRFEDCGESNNGVIHFAKCGGLEFTFRDSVILDTAGGEALRVHEGGAPDKVYIDGVKTDSGVELVSSEIKELTIKSSEFSFCHWRRVTTLTILDSKIGRLGGNNGGSNNRFFHFERCIFGEGRSNGTLMSGEPYANIYIDQCLFVYDSDDGSHAYISLSDRSDVTVVRCKDQVVNEDPTAAFVGDFHTHLFVYGEKYGLNHLTKDQKSESEVRIGPVYQEDVFVHGSEPVAYGTGDTGGDGSAGDGNQYVAVNIGGTTYRLLHDGTID